jgi:DNA-binding CsgD family transcriptional regulator
MSRNEELSEARRSARELHAIAIEVLSQRQLAVFRLWSLGHGTARIAHALDISESTVRVHLRRATQLIAIELKRR